MTTYQLQEVGSLEKEKMGPSRTRGENLTGRRFGMLCVLERAPCGKTARKPLYADWVCQCDCGGSITVSSKKLKRGTVRDCGCVPKKAAKNGTIAEDLTGRTFGSLTVLYREENKNRRVRWRCRCKCGNLHSAAAGDLKSGYVKSCGCGREKYKALIITRPHHINGTTIERLGQQRPRSDNLLQTIGVTRRGNRAFEATIGLCGEHYRLGRYKSLEEAAMVRQQAQRQLHEPVIEAFRRWSAYAEEHSDWAEEHPLSFTVQRLAQTEFKVELFGLPEQENPVGDIGQAAENKRKRAV